MSCSLRCGASLETPLIAVDERLVPEHGVHHGPQLKAVAAAALDLAAEHVGEERVVEEGLFPDGRSLESRKTAPPEISLAEPFLHGGAEALLSTMDHIAIEIRLGRLFQNRLSHAV